MYPYFHIFGYSFPAYGVMCALAILVSLTMCLVRVRKRGLPIDRPLILYTGALAGGMAGSVLTYGIITYGFSGLRDMLTGRVPVGFVFYGGLLFGLTFARFFMRLLRLNVSDCTRAMLPALPLGHALGRVGCHLAGCCYGCPTEGVFRVFYPASHITSGTGVVPVQLIEAALLLLICAVLVLLARSERINLLRAYILLYAPMRFILEFFRGDAIRGIGFGLSTSQWISLFLLVCIIPIKKLHSRA